MVSISLVICELHAFYFGYLSFYLFFDLLSDFFFVFFFQAEDGIRDTSVMEFRRVLFRSRECPVSRRRQPSVRLPPRSVASSAESSSPRTSFHRTLSELGSSTRARLTFPPSSGPSSATFFSLTRSTGRRPKSSRPCSRSCRKGRLRSERRPSRLPSLSWSLPRRSL